VRNQYLFFGQFLRKEGLISEEDIFQARSLQKKRNRRIGELAMEKGWITGEKVDRVLVMQEDTEEKFGEIAVSQGYLTEAQVGELLERMDDGYLFFGEALVQLGVLKMEVMVEKLNEFNTVFGNAAMPGGARPAPRAELSKHRLIVKDCEHMDACDFFKDNIKNAPRDAPIMRVRYCMGDRTGCARYRVYQALGKGHAPHDLFPDQTDRAMALIGRRAVQG
jgi:hypothetical protein